MNHEYRTGRLVPRATNHPGGERLPGADGGVLPGERWDHVAEAQQLHQVRPAPDALALHRSLRAGQAHLADRGFHRGVRRVPWRGSDELGTAQRDPRALNHQRRIIGFDTFGGFPELSAWESEHSPKAAQGLFSGVGDVWADLQTCIELYDANRFINHIPKVSLVRGDITETLPRYLESNQHTVVSLLYMDFDLLEPTRVALRHLVPRMPKGAIIAFDELNHPDWPGETMAVMEEVGLSNLRIEKLPFDAMPSFAVIE